MRAAVVLGVALTVWGMACARGSDLSDEYELLEGAGGSNASGAGGSMSNGSGSSSSGTMSNGAGGSSGVGGSGSGGGPVCDFTSPNQCANATNIGILAGDKNQPAVVIIGTTSEWFVIKIEEQDSNIFEEDMSYTVWLESPASTAYDLFVYQGAQDGPPNCNATPKVGTLINGELVVSDGWDDDQGFGGEDDSVYLCIEVVWVSGEDCTSPYTLTVQGHT
jgi:hypothetical protein